MGVTRQRAHCNQIVVNVCIYLDRHGHRTYITVVILRVGLLRMWCRRGCSR